MYGSLVVPEPVTFVPAVPVDAVNWTYLLLLTLLSSSSSSFFALKTKSFSPIIWLYWSNSIIFWVILLRLYFTDLGALFSGEAKKKVKEKVEEFKKDTEEKIEAKKEELKEAVEEKREEVEEKVQKVEDKVESNIEKVKDKTNELKKLKLKDIIK